MLAVAVVAAEQFVVVAAAFFFRVLVALDCISARAVVTTRRNHPIRHHCLGYTDVVRRTMPPYQAPSPSVAPFVCP